MPSDSRIERVAATWATSGDLANEHPAAADHWRRQASQRVALIEAAGLIVIDPDDEATIERVSRTIADQHGGYTGDWQHQTDEARAILAALAVKP